jgi:hypothetical protein
MTHHAQDGRPGAKQTVWALAATCSAGALTMVDAPWWVRVLCVLAGLAYGALQIVFPRRSADRLSWWTNRRHYRAMRCCHRGCPGERPMGATDGSDGPGCC